MTDIFHYPPDVFELLVETIPRLFRGKKAVVLFLQGAGVPQEDIIGVARIVQTDPKSINKFEISTDKMKDDEKLPAVSVLFSIICMIITGILYWLKIRYGRKINTIWGCF